MPLNIPQGNSEQGNYPSLLGTAPTFPNLLSQEGRIFMQVPTIKRQKLDDNNDGLNTGMPKNTSKRRKVSGMTSEERLQWARHQSAQHSKKTRERHKAMEKDLRTEIEQLKSFRTLVEASHQLVSIHSTCEKGAFLYANSVFFRALNYAPQDLIGQSLLNLCHPEDRRNLTTALMRATSGDESSPCVTVDWRIHSLKRRHLHVEHYAVVTSSMSVNRQGLVLFSMLHDGAELTNHTSCDFSGLRDLSCAASTMPQKEVSAPLHFTRVISVDSSYNDSPGCGYSEHSPYDDHVAESVREILTLGA